MDDATEQKAKARRTIILHHPAMVAGGVRPPLTLLGPRP
jgi:hypothetical protein